MTGELVLVANAGEGTVSAFALDMAAGRLALLATSPVGRGCSTFVVDETHDLVYAATKGEADGAGEGVDSFRLDRASGRLELLDHVDAVGQHHLALAHRGTVLAGAAYHAGRLTTWTLDGTGGFGPEAARADWPHAHCVATVGDHLYVVSLGADAIGQYAVTVDGLLSPLDPPFATAPEGSGPRHLVLDEGAAHAYVMTEFSGEILTYERDPAGGILTPIGSAPGHATDRGLSRGRLGGDPRGEHLVWGADLHLARGGRLVLASERTESTLTSVRIAEDGVADEQVDVVDTERQPRGFAVTGDGRYAVVAGEASTDVMLMTIGADGSLRALSRTPTGSGANWVRTLPRA